MSEPLGNCECGAPLAETGPPIWETYCTDKLCKVAWNKMVASLRNAPLLPLTGRYAEEVKRITAELRHAYTHLAGCDHPTAKGVANGILSRQIERLEKLTDPHVVKLTGGA